MTDWENFEFNEPFSGELIREVNGVKLPQDYLNFMKEHNGCEADLGNILLILYRLEDLNQMNIDYEINEFLPNNCIIGSNGGGEFFGIDAEGNYFIVPCVMDEDDKILLGNTMLEFIEKANHYFE